VHYSVHTSATLSEVAAYARNLLAFDVWMGLNLVGSSPAEVPASSSGDMLRKLTSRGILFKGGKGSQNVQTDCAQHMKVRLPTPNRAERS
jgi:hypothetical protein